MRIPLFHLDAFTSQPLGGHPAAGCPLQACLDDALLHKVAAENNLSEAAFIVLQAGSLRSAMVYAPFGGSPVWPCDPGVGLRDIEPAASRVPNGPIRDAAQRGFDR